MLAHCTRRALRALAPRHRNRAAHRRPAGSMEGQAAPPAPVPAAPTPAAALDFLGLLTNLKTTKRTGWVLRGVAGPESIADHMYRMAMMALVVGDCGADQTRCMKMALVHDVAEALVGDITPHCKVSKEEKQRREEAAVSEIERMLGPSTAAAREVGALWREYEAGTSPEARLVKDFDKLEMIIQAHEYEGAQPGLALQEFFDSTAGRFQTPVGQAWAAELVARRAARQQQQASGS